MAANLARGLPDDAVTLIESDASLGGASLRNAGLVVGGGHGYRHRLPLEPPAAIGRLGRAVLESDGNAATALLARRDGARVTVADVYLADPPPNLEVLTGVAVDRVVIENRRAIGVQAVGGEHLAGDRVVLCAGAVTTPALLLRSGVTDIPGVGLGLQNHPGCALSLELTGGAPDAAVPDVTVTVERDERQVVVVERTPEVPSLGALLAGFLAPIGSGSVTLPDPEGPPSIELACDDADVDGLRVAAELAIGIARHPAVAAVTGAVYVDDHGTRLDRLLAGGDQAVAAWARTASNPYHHFAGSCRLGVVTDDIGRVWLYSALSVCDASLLPGVPRRNPYLSVIDLAERLSSAWLAGLRR